MTKRGTYPADYDAELNRQFIDALRECLGIEPLYAPVSNLTRESSPIHSLAWGRNPAEMVRSEAMLRRKGAG